MVDDEVLQSGKSKRPAGSTIAGTLHKLLALEIFVLSLLVSPVFLQASYKTEWDWTRAIDGPFDFGIGAWVNHQGSLLYKKSMIETGIQDSLLSTGARSQAEAANEGWGGHLGGFLTRFYGDRPAVAIIAAKMLCLRLAYFWLWLPVFAMVIYGIYMDGRASRRINGWKFDRRDSVWIENGKRGMSFASHVIPVCLFSPLPLPPVWVPTLAVLYCIMAHMVRRKLQKI